MAAPAEERAWVVGREKAPPLRVRLLACDIAEAPAAAICTSTNPRLSLLAGTGAAVVAAGGWGVKRQAEAVLARERDRTGEAELPPGSVHATTGGTLPCDLVLHCVASDARHRSSPEVVAECVGRALSAAVAGGCRSVAFPLLGAGHASLEPEVAVSAMAGCWRRAPGEVDEVVLAVPDPHRFSRTARALDAELGVPFV